MAKASKTKRRLWVTEAQKRVRLMFFGGLITAKDTETVQRIFDRALKRV